ncbi:MAG TPA: hypothetical protein VIE37_03125 [Methylomirabilota bacterium]
MTAAIQQNELRPGNGPSQRFGEIGGGQAVIAGADHQRRGPDGSATICPVEGQDGIDPALAISTVVKPATDAACSALICSACWLMYQGG